MPPREMTAPCYGRARGPKAQPSPRPRPTAASGSTHQAGLDTLAGELDREVAAVLRVRQHRALHAADRLAHRAGADALVGLRPHLHPAVQVACGVALQL